MRGGIFTRVKNEEEKYILKYTKLFDTNLIQMGNINSTQNELR